MLTSDERPAWTGALPVTVARWLVRPATAGDENGPWDDRPAAGAELGQRLARRLATRRASGSAVVLGLGGFGLQVAAGVAEQLDGELDALLVAPLRLAGQDAPAVVAVAGAGSRLDLVRTDSAGDLSAAEAFGEDWLHRIRDLVQEEAELRAGIEAPDLAGRVVVLAVDSVADADAPLVVAAARAARRHAPAHLVVAAGAASPEAGAVLAPECDELLCAWTSAAVTSRDQPYRRRSPVAAGAERSVLIQARTTAATGGAVRPPARPRG